MSTQTTRPAHLYTSILAFLTTLVLLVVSFDARAFEIDFSRRRRQVQKTESEKRSIETKEVGDAFMDLFTNTEPSTEYVLLNTEKGFVPSKLALRKGFKYTIHLVNVNDRERNVSFVLDAFSEHHATFFGKIRSFDVKPAQDGVFTFTCPETGAEGRIVVFSPSKDINVRAPASDRSDKKE